VQVEIDLLHEQRGPGRIEEVNEARTVVALAVDLAERLGVEEGLRRMRARGRMLADRVREALVARLDGERLGHLEYRLRAGTRERKHQLAAAHRVATRQRRQQPHAVARVVIDLARGHAAAVLEAVPVTHAEAVADLPMAEPVAEQRRFVRVRRGGIGIGLWLRRVVR
jgi:hypothetical protein